MTPLIQQYYSSHMSEPDSSQLCGEHSLIAPQQNKTANQIGVNGVRVSHPSPLSNITNTHTNDINGT